MSRIKLKKWQKAGFAWGLFMFLIMTIVWPLIDGDEITVKSVIVGIIIWAVAGLAFGWSMRHDYNKN